MQMLKAWRIRKMCLCKRHRWKQPWWVDGQDAGRTHHRLGKYHDGRNRWTIGPHERPLGVQGGVSCHVFLPPNMDVSDSFDFKYRVFLECIMPVLWSYFVFLYQWNGVLLHHCLFSCVMHPSKTSYVFFLKVALYLLWECSCRYLQ